MRGRKVRLVPLERGHLAATKAWANDPELIRLLNRARPVTDDEHEQWFVSLSGRQDCLYFAVEAADEGVHVGNVWLWDIEPRHRRAEVRILIGAPGPPGSGLGVESIDLISRYAFERLDLHKLVAQVLAINPRALGAFEKAGFEIEGVLRADRWTGDEFVDVYALGRQR
jgi:RimJ/RimL family protein N-acetyltransferase